MAILLGSMAVGFIALSAPVHAASNSVGIAIPLYTYPTDSSWSAVIHAKQAYPNVPFIAIINPSSGPGTSQDSNYVQGIKNLQAAGIKVLGYVDTAYGGDSVSSVESNVNLYHQWYGVNGIFFDDMSNQAAYETYYSTLTSYVHSLIPGSTTLGNPGTSVPTGFIGTMDVLCIYESSGYPSLSFITYPGYSTSNFYMVAFGVSLNTSFLTNAAGSVAWVYVTDATLPNPYDVLPSYFTSEVAALSAIDGTTTSSSTTTSTSSTSSVTVSSVDLSGNTITGMWTTWNQNGVVLSSGYTTVTFTGTIGKTYTAVVGNYGSTVFCHWQDGSTSASKTLTLNGNVALKAYYSTTGSCPSSTTFKVTVNSETTSGSAVSGLYVTVSQGGTTVATGFTPFTFTATSGIKYTITVSNYGSYTFSYWSTGSTSPSITISPTQAVTLVAYYTISTSTGGHNHK